MKLWTPKFEIMLAWWHDLRICKRAPRPSEFWQFDKRMRITITFFCTKTRREPKQYETTNAMRVTKVVLQRRDCMFCVWFPSTLTAGMLSNWAYHGNSASSYWIQQKSIYVHLFNVFIECWHVLVAMSSLGVLQSHRKPHLQGDSCLSRWGFCHLLATLAESLQLLT